MCLLVNSHTDRNACRTDFNISGVSSNRDLNYLNENGCEMKNTILKVIALQFPKNKTTDIFVEVGTKSQSRNIKYNVAQLNVFFPKTERIRMKKIQSRGQVCASCRPSVGQNL